MAHSLGLHNCTTHKSSITQRPQNIYAGNKSHRLCHYSLRESMESSRSIHICFNAASANRECLGNETGLMQVVVLPPYADIYRKEVALKISQVIGKWLLLAHLTCLQMEVYIQTSDTQRAGMPSCVHVVLEKGTNHPFTSTNVEMWQSWGLVFTFGEGW